MIDTTKLKALSLIAAPRPYSRRGRMAIASADKKLVVAIDRVGNYRPGGDWPDVDFMIEAANMVEPLLQRIEELERELDAHRGW